MNRIVVPGRRSEFVTVAVPKGALETVARPEHELKTVARAGVNAGSLTQSRKVAKKNLKTLRLSDFA